MACDPTVKENDIGTEFVVVIVAPDANCDLQPKDISNATDKKIIFLMDNGNKRLAKDAVFTSVASGGAGDGTDGKISYFTVDGDLTPKGKVKIQGIVTTPDGTWHSEIGQFTIGKNL